MAGDNNDGKIAWPCPQTQSESQGDDDGTDFSFDPGSQVELELEENCCLTGDPVPASFCRFPDYRQGTMMVMNRKATLEHLRDNTTIDTFKEVLVKRHGKRIVERLYSTH